MVHSEVNDGNKKENSDSSDQVLPEGDRRAASGTSNPRESANRSFSPKLKAYTPPALKHDDGGAHSPTHQSNSTSPFYMGDHRHVGEDNLHSSAHNNNNVVPWQRSAFAARQPSQTHVNDDAISPNVSSHEGEPMYPTNTDVHVAALTAFEEQPARGQGWGIPSVVVLRHRMGFSTVVLTPYQRRMYSRHDLENFVLYKEQKYNAVNVLWRFCMLLLLVLTFSVFCLVFSTCTTEWVGLQHVDTYFGLGLFVACRYRSLGSCNKRISARMEWTVTDAATGATLCTASADFVRNYVGAMWSMAILQLLCEFIAVLLIAWIVIRPTRSHALIGLFFDLLLGTVCGIVAVVLFHHYSSCLRRTCEGAHLTGRVCRVKWQYGYKLYIGSLAVHGVALILSLCMHSFIHNIRVTARKQLRAERRRASRRHAEAEEYMVQLLNSPASRHGDQDGKNNSHNNNGGEEQEGGAEAAFHLTTPTEEHQCAAERCGEKPGNMNSDTVVTPHFSHHDPQDPLGRSPMHVLFSDITDGGGENKLELSTSHKPRGTASGDRTQGQPSSLSEQNTMSFSNNSIVSGGGDAGGMINPNKLSERTVAESIGRSELSRNSFLAPMTQQQQYRRYRQRGQWQRGSAEYLTSSRHCPQHHHVPPTSPKRKSSTDTAEYRQARKRKRFIDRFFQREYDANYLTAAELGVPIEGATDWVYDDRSDMYYSFERNMFWDPLTREYYNCALNTWQESPDQVVEVRDVLDYMTEDSLSGGMESDQAGHPPGNNNQHDNDNDNDNTSTVVQYSDVVIGINGEDDDDQLRQTASQHNTPAKATAARAARGAESNTAEAHGSSGSSQCDKSRSANTAKERGEEAVFGTELEGHTRSESEGRDLHTLHSFLSKETSQC